MQLFRGRFLFHKLHAVALWLTLLKNDVTVLDKPTVYGQPCLKYPNSNFLLMEEEVYTEPY